MGRDTCITVADIIYRLDACSRRRKDIVKMGKESYRFLRSEFKGVKRYDPCFIAIGYAKAITDDLRGAWNVHFLDAERQASSKQRHKASTLGSVKEAL